MPVDTEAELQSRTLRRAQRQATQLQADQELIDAGSGRRSAKVKAINDAAWLAAEGRRAPRKPKGVEAGDTAKRVSAVVIRKRGREASPASPVVSPDAEEVVQRKREQLTDLNQRSSKPKSSQTLPFHDDGDLPPAKRNKLGRPGFPKTARSTVARVDDDSADTRSEASDHASSGSSEDDDGLLGMGGDELARTLGSEVPQIARIASSKSKSMPIANIWDISDDEVHMASRRPSRASPDSRDESDVDDSSDKENRNEDDDVATQRGDKRNPSKRLRSAASKPEPKRKTSSKREQTWKNETPAIRGRSASAKTKPRAKVVDDTSVESESISCAESDTDLAASKPKWPATARLQGNGLTQQNTLIRALCRDAIKIVETTIVTTHAWPELNRLAEYRREVLLQAATRLLAKNSEFLAIRKRLKTDESFTKAVGKWVMDRLPHARSAVKARGMDHIALFQLGIGALCAERVHALMDNDCYIYPGRWSVDDTVKATWVIKPTEIYLNPGLVAVLKTAYFATPTAFGRKFKQYYVSSHATRVEAEFPASLVALAATGLFAALHSWQSGSKVDQEKFDGDRFSAVYERHLSYLNSIKSDNLNAYHSLMSRLYSQVMDGDNNKEGPKVTMGSALGLLDLSEFM